MNLDLAGSALQIADLAGRDIDPADAMQRLIDWCAAQRAHDDWKRLSSLDFAAELKRLERWLDNVLTTEPPASSVTGIFFGLFNPQYSDNEGTVADIYVAGGIYGDNDWLSEVSQNWWPDGRYAHSQLLAQVYRIAYESPSGLANDMEYPVVLGFGVFATKWLCQATKAKLFGRRSESFHVAVGFDSGDVLTLGELSTSGLTPILRW